VELGAKEDAKKLPAEKSGKITTAFPWGSGWPPPPDAGNYAGEEINEAQKAGKYTDMKNVIEGYNDGFVETAPVGSFKMNRFGLFDMGGNVWQWCEDWYDQEHKDRVLRGASWNHGERGSLLSSYRVHYAPAPRSNDRNGFRCVVGVSAR
jgi:formylglycine-generating enzyme required for sulfatase activity